MLHPKHGSNNRPRLGSSQTHHANAPTARRSRNGDNGVVKVHGEIVVLDSKSEFVRLGWSHMSKGVRVTCSEGLEVLSCPSQAEIAVRSTANFIRIVMI